VSRFPNGWLSFLPGGVYIAKLKSGNGVILNGISNMRLSLRQAVVTATASAMVLGSSVAFGVEGGGNPYADIVTRNAFGLKAPEPPKAPEPVQEQEAPSNIELTGMTAISGKKQVFLKLTTPGEKDPKYLSLGENERDGAIEVTEINPKAGRARIKNRGLPQTISFETHGSKLSAAAPVAARPGIPGVPGAPGVPPVPGAPQATFINSTATPAPAVYTSTPAATSTLSVSPNNSSIASPRPQGTSTLTPTQTPATRTVPTRPMRTPGDGGGASYQPAPNVNPAAQAVQIEVNRATQPPDFPPLPPTPLSNQ
jgi:hypothetical protein